MPVYLAPGARSPVSIVHPLFTFADPFGHVMGLPSPQQEVADAASFLSHAPTCIVAAGYTQGNDPLIL
jgi:hypothetical protein